MATLKQRNNRKDWFAALEGGRYKQTTETLYRTQVDPGYVRYMDGTRYPPKPKGYCCLGVAARVAKVKSRSGGYFVFPSNEELDDDKIIDPTKLQGFSVNEGTPPYDWFAHQFGVTKEQARDIVGRATTLNDTERQTFPVIADELKTLFKAADEENKLEKQWAKSRAEKKKPLAKPKKKAKKRA